MSRYEQVESVEVRAIFVDGMVDEDAEFFVRALEALVESVDPDGWVEVLDRRVEGKDALFRLVDGNGRSDSLPEASGDDTELEVDIEKDEHPCPWCGKVCASAGGLGSHKRACPEKPVEDGGKTPNQRTFGTREKNAKETKALARS